MNIASILATKGGHVITIRPEHTVKAAVAALVQHNIGALVVVNAANDLIGIVTERHIVREVAGNPQVFTQTIGDIMTRDVITGAPHDDLLSVARTMAEKRIRHLPIVDKGKLVGLVTLGDVVRAQRDTYRGEAETLETRILG